MFAVILVLLPRFTVLAPEDDQLSFLASHWSKMWDFHYDRAREKGTMLFLTLHFLTALNFLWVLKKTTVIFNSKHCYGKNAFKIAKAAQSFII